MFFSSKTKGYFVEQSDHTLLLARTSAPVAPMVIEEMRLVPAGDADAIAEAIHVVQPKPGPSGYMNACCGVYPGKRLVRRAALELKRTKEPNYFPELLTSQFRIEPDKYTIHLINAVDGTDYDVGKATQKEVLFCGVPSEDIVTAQDSLLASGIYPDALELGSVSTLGALVDYFAFTKSKTPTLVLEIGTEITHSFIVSSGGVEASRPIPQGLDAMVPIVQKELGLKDEESARKLFYSNTFDFTGMGPLLVKKLLKELQSSIGFYEVQTGQSVGQVICTMLPSKLSWLDAAIAGALGVSSTKLDLVAWLQSRQVTIPEGVAPEGIDLRWLGLLSLMANSAPVPSPANAIAEKKD
ncbi:MAG: hypothetical protein ABI222_11885 [Opitutaceae bacterium]